MGGPVHRIFVIGLAGVRHSFAAAAIDFVGGGAGVGRGVELARVVAQDFHDVDLGRPRAVRGDHPESRPQALAGGKLHPGFEEAIELAERVIGVHLARGILIAIDQRLDRRGRRRARNRENAVLDGPRGHRTGLWIVGVDVPLLLAIGREGAAISVEGIIGKIGIPGARGSIPQAQIIEGLAKGRCCRHRFNLRYALPAGGERTMRAFLRQAGNIRTWSVSAMMKSVYGLIFQAREGCMNRARRAAGAWFRSQARAPRFAFVSADFRERNQNFAPGTAER